MLLPVRVPVRVVTAQVAATILREVTKFMLYFQRQSPGCVLCFGWGCYCVCLNNTLTACMPSCPTEHPAGLAVALTPLLEQGVEDSTSEEMLMAGGRWAHAGRTTRW